MKPADIPALVRAIESKLTTPLLQRHLPPPKRVAMVLQEHVDRIENLWLSSVENDSALSRVAMDKEQRLDYVRGILEQLFALRNRTPAKRPRSTRSFLAGTMSGAI